MGLLLFIVLMADRAGPAACVGAPDPLLLAGACAFRLTGEVRDLHGQPIAGARVQAWQRSDCAHSRTTITGADGAFEVCTWPGTFWVQATADGRALGRDVDKTPRLSFVLEPQVVIEGRVTAPGGAPLRADVVLLDTQTAGEMRTVHTGADGRYRLEHVSSGTARLEIRAAGHRVLSKYVMSSPPRPPRFAPAGSR